MYIEHIGYVSLHKPELEKLKMFVEEKLTDHYITDGQIKIEVSDELELLRGDYLTATELYVLEDCTHVVFYLH